MVDPSPAVNKMYFSCRNVQIFIYIELGLQMCMEGFVFMRINFMVTYSSMLCLLPARYFDLRSNKVTVKENYRQNTVKDL